MKKRLVPAAADSDQTVTVHRYRVTLVWIRTFVGIVYLTNALAKVFGVRSLTLGPWKSYLINRDVALGIQKSNTGSAPGFLHDLGNLVVNNWDVMQWLLTAGELAVGVGLVLGLLGRLSAIVGFLLAFSTFLFAMGSGGWTYDYLFEPVLLAILVFAEPLPGLDSRMPWARSAVAADHAGGSMRQPAVR